MMNILESVKNSFADIKDDRMKNYPLMGGSQFQIIVITIIYYLLAKQVGPNFMEKRKPYNLKIQMQIYNILQIVFNTWLSIDLIFIYNKKTFSFTCTNLDVSTTPEGLKEGNLVYFYLVLKIFDLTDTLFIILKKDNHRLSFLHLYHHGSMCILTQLITQYSPGGPYSTVVTLNSFVHVVMYSYYFLTSIRPEIKESIWWKKYITQLQMCQFCLLFLHFSLHIFSSECKYSKFWGAVGVIQNLILLNLFSNFYIKTYVLKKKDELNMLKVQ